MNEAFATPMNLYAAQLNAAKRLVDVYVAGTQRMEHIFLEAAKDVLHAEIDGAKAVAQCRTPQEFWSLAEARRPNYERMVARNNDMLREFAEFGAHAFNAAQGIATQAQAETSAAMTGDTTSRPGAMVNPFGPMFDFWQSSSQRMLDAMQPAAAPAAKPPAGKNRSA